MKNLKEVLQAVEEKIRLVQIERSPDELFAPYAYIMQLGGKRMRPVLTLWGYYLLRDDWQNALLPATATEVFHNFTLVHDDIMDNAPLRRGKATVHEKWNRDIGILSGDMMLIEAYRILNLYPFENLQKVIELFSLCAIDVCRGQQFDMNFATQTHVGIEDYIEMIRLKTAVLPAFCLQLGAYCAGANDEIADKLRIIGEKIGIAFQIKDDLLDAFGDAETFGKQTGGDILENKKTLLYLHAFANAKGDEVEKLKNAFALAGEAKVNAVKDCFRALKSDVFAEKEAERYFVEAFALLENLPADAEKKKLMLAFFENIRDRKY